MWITYFLILNGEISTWLNSIAWFYIVISWPTRMWIMIKDNLDTISILWLILTSILNNVNITIFLTKLLCHVTDFKSLIHLGWMKQVIYDVYLMKDKTFINHIKIKNHVKIISNPWLNRHLHRKVEYPPGWITYIDKCSIKMKGTLMSSISQKELWPGGLVFQLGSLSTWNIHLKKMALFYPLVDENCSFFHNSLVYTFSQQIEPINWFQPTRKYVNLADLKCWICTEEPRTWPYRECEIY